MVREETKMEIDALGIIDAELFVCVIHDPLQLPVIRSLVSRGGSSFLLLMAVSITLQWCDLDTQQPCRLLAQEKGVADSSSLF